MPKTYLADADQVQGSRVNELSWREYFSDPVLLRLIETGLHYNRDLRVTILRVEEARSTFRIQRSERFPEVDLRGQGGRSRIPGDLSSTGNPTTSGNYRAEVGLNTWELDFWGRIRSLEDSVLESWLATDAAAQAVHVTLIAQIANTYLAVRELDERIGIARNSVESRQESYRIFQRRYEVGATSKLDVAQVETLLTQAQSLLVQLQQQYKTQVHALWRLVGSDPGIFPDKTPFDETTVLTPLSAGLPSELMISRPDVIAAEHRLRASNANIGAARAAFSRALC